MQGAAALLDALAEPALLVDGEGRVAAMNRAARDRLGDLRGRPLAGAHEGDAVALDRWLARARGSAAALPGALRAGGERLRARAGRLVLPGGWTGVLLRLDPAEESRFVALAAKVAELDAELARRARAEAVLAAALEERDALLRELQHRVKNMAQMLAGLLRGAAREAGSAEARAALHDAALRAGAVGAVQSLLHGATDLQAVPARPLIEAIARAAAGPDPRASIAVEAPEAEPPLPVALAVPLALAVNEVVGNALRHGRDPDGRAAVRVTWGREGDWGRLGVEDEGPGFGVAPEAGLPRRASGLGLVRGLLGQAGGTLETGPRPGGGARVTLRLPLAGPPLPSRAGGVAA
jgi:two-component sensor histidine kinase